MALTRREQESLFDALPTGTVVRSDVLANGRPGDLLDLSRINDGILSTDSLNLPQQRKTIRTAVPVGAAIIDRRLARAGSSDIFITNPTGYWERLLS